MPAWLDWVTLRPFDQVSKGVNNWGLGEGEWGIMKITDNLSVVTLGKFRQLCNIWWFEVKQIQYFCLKICVCVSNYNLVRLACEFGWSLVIVKSELQVECALTALQMRWLWTPGAKLVAAVISLPAELMLLTPPTVSRKQNLLVVLVTSNCDLLLFRSEADPVSSDRWKELHCRRAQGRSGIWTRSLMWFWIKHRLCPWMWREMNPLCFGLKILLWNFKSVNFLFFQRIVLLPTLKLRYRVHPKGGAWRHARTLSHLCHISVQFRSVFFQCVPQRWCVTFRGDDPTIQLSITSCMSHTTFSWPCNILVSVW